MKFTDMLKGKIAEPVNKVGTLAVLALVIAVIALFAVVSKGHS